MSDRFDAWLEAGLRQLDAAVPVGEPALVGSSHLAAVRVARSGSRSILPLGLIVAAVVVVSFIALVSRSPSAGPGAASPAAAGTSVASAPSSGAPSPTPPGDVTRVFGNLSFVAPADWAIVAPHVWTAPTGPRLFLSNAPIADPCPTEWVGIQCWLPLTTLPADGILVTFEGSATLGPPNPTPISVARSAEGQCAQIGGDREYGVPFQGFGVDACLRGPDLEANAAAVARLVGSIARVSTSLPSPTLVTEQIDGLTVTHPVTWQVIRAPAGSQRPSRPLFYLSDVPLTVEPCPSADPATGVFGPCPEPVAALPPGGVLVTVATNPGLAALVPPLVNVQAANPACKSLGGETEVESVVGGAVVDACLRGPDLAGAEDQVRGLIAALSQAP